MTRTALSLITAAGLVAGLVLVAVNPFESNDTASAARTFSAAVVWKSRGRMFTMAGRS